MKRKKTFNFFFYYIIIMFAINDYLFIDVCMNNFLLFFDKSIYILYS